MLQRGCERGFLDHRDTYPDLSLTPSKAQSNGLGGNPTRE
jgi:hypothetical protein